MIRPLLVAACFASIARADYDPIPLTSSSFNYDVVVESSGVRSASRYVTAVMDGNGTNVNGGGNVWYEVGFNATNLPAGIPAAGSTFTHQTFSDHSYRMPPTYDGPNAIFLGTSGGGGPITTNGTFTVTSPAIYGGLSVLAAGGNAGGGLAVNFTITYTDDTTQDGTISVGDWFNGSNPAWTANGRVNGKSLALDVQSGNPRLYGYDITVANSTTAIKSIKFTYATTGGRVSILALSGNPVGGGSYAPIAVTGYTYDMVVEASAIPAAAYKTATTASMDGGTNNTANTWFERGYDIYNPTFGLPTAGSVITSLSLPDHHYQMPSSYTINNVAMVDTNAPEANLTLATPMPYSALSFLSATANGTVTNQCIMQYADGTQETNTFLSRDWFNNSPYAFTANARVDLGNRTITTYTDNNPRLYEAQFSLGNTTSPITNVVLKWIGGSVSSRVVVFAVSGTAGAVRPIISVHPVPSAGMEGKSLTLSAQVVGTAPITYSWQKLIDGSFVSLTNTTDRIIGATTTNLVLTNLVFSDTGDYRLAAQNSAGVSTSIVARATVVSAMSDVTSPTDVITGFGGSTPDAEGVSHLIDNAGQKYLNFGLNGGTPFLGPVGAIITPLAGPTKVKGVRFYTANDATERDPASFSLEGSVDNGATFTMIISNALALPSARNGGGAGTVVDPVTQAIQEILFANDTAYEMYRLTFYDVKNASAANSMQLGEVELLGTVNPRGPKLKITLQSGGTEIVVTSSQPAILQGTDQLKGAQTEWLEYGEVSEAAPFYFQNDGTSAQYFRTVPLNQ